MNPTSGGKTILYGSRGPYSAAVLSGLVSKDIPISHIFCAGVAPASRIKNALPVNQPGPNETLDVLARQHRIPVNYISRPSDFESFDQSEIKGADYLLVACFPYRIPRSISCSPRIGSLNLHPSQLPHYRGPDPIFWQLKNGEADTGISLHMLTDDFDSGPVVLQTPVDYGDGACRNDIEEKLGLAGATLFSYLVTQSGSLSDSTQLSQLAKQQDEGDSSYYPIPTDADYELSPSWSAQHAYNFIRGTWPPLGQYRIVIDGKLWIISEALDFSNKGTLSEPVKKETNEIYIQFSPGILRSYAHEA